MKRNMNQLTWEKALKEIISKLSYLSLQNETNFV